MSKSFMSKLNRSLLHPRHLGSPTILFVYYECFVRLLRPLLRNDHLNHSTLQPDSLNLSVVCSFKFNKNER